MNKDEEVTWAIYMAKYTTPLNITTIIEAAKVLACRVEELEKKNKELRQELFAENFDKKIYNMDD